MAAAGAAAVAVAVADTDLSLIDSLPYIDEDYASISQDVEQLIQDELRVTPRRNYMEDISQEHNRKSLTLFAAEVQRIKSKQPRIDGLDKKRYELPQPVAAKRLELGAWKGAVDNIHAQLTHQADRLANLELLSSYGQNAWKLNCEQTEELAARLKNELTQVQADIQTVNRQRKNEQTEAGAQLTELEYRWQALVSKNLQIEQSCLHLDNQVKELHKLV